MKNFCIFVLLCVVASSVTGSDKYTTKYDNIDLDEILNNDRLLKNYLDCIMDRGRCTPDSQELRSTYFKFESLKIEKKVFFNKKIFFL